MIFVWLPEFNYREGDHRSWRRRFAKDTPAVPDCRTRHRWRGRGRRSSLGAAAPFCSPLCNWQNFHFRSAPAPRRAAPRRDRSCRSRAPRLIGPDPFRDRRRFLGAEDQSPRSETKGRWSKRKRLTLNVYEHLSKYWRWQLNFERHLKEISERRTCWSERFHHESTYPSSRILLCILTKANRYFDRWYF